MPAGTVTIHSLFALLRARNTPQKDNGEPLAPRLFLLYRFLRAHVAALKNRKRTAKAV
jgi:hypothetical protein